MSNFLGGGSGGGAVSSVFGRAGAVVAAEGDYSLSQLSDVSGTSGSGSTVPLSTITAAATGDVLSFSAGNWVNSFVGLITRADDDGTVALVTGDKDTVVTAGNATANAVSIAQAGTAGFPLKWTVNFCTTGAGVSTITPATSTIWDGSTAAATLTLAKGDCATIFVSSVTGNGAYFSVIKRAVPTRTTGTTNFLREDYTFAAAAGGGSVIVNKQDVLAPITLAGAGTDTTLYTTSVAGSTIVAGECLRVWTHYRHTTGTGAVTFKLFFGATSITLLTAGTTSTVPLQTSALICNNNGSTTAQTINEVSYIWSASPFPDITTSAETTTGAVVLKLTADGAVTEAVTPQIWLVEKVK